MGHHYCNYSFSMLGYVGDSKCSHKRGKALFDLAVHQSSANAVYSTSRREHTYLYTVP